MKLSRVVLVCVVVLATAAWAVEALAVPPAPLTALPQSYWEAPPAPVTCPNYQTVYDVLPNELIQSIIVWVQDEDTHHVYGQAPYTALDLGWDAYIGQMIGGGSAYLTRLSDGTRCAWRVWYTAPPSWPGDYLAACVTVDMLDTMPPDWPINNAADGPRIVNAQYTSLPYTPPP